MCLSLLMLLLQWNWNHLYVKAEHRMSADLISVTWFMMEGMVWLIVMVISSLTGFRGPLKDPQTNEKSNPTPTSKALHQAFLVQDFSELLRNFISCNYQLCFYNWRGIELGATKWKPSICIWTFRKFCPDHTTVLDNHGFFS